MKTNVISLFKNKLARKVFLLVCLAAIFTGIAALFWYNELVYNLPTPVPANYHDVKSGSYVDVSQKIKIHNNKPVFLHFFNPDCPCSRFNMQHFKSLVKKYISDMDFVVVVMAKNNRYTAKAVQDKFGFDLPVLFDSSLAAATGVYSTPQAVILDNNKIFFRGNYNKSRYCTNPNSNYAQMAIDSLLHHKTQLHFDNTAYRAYGCQLPTCKK